MALSNDYVNGRGGSDGRSYVPELFKMIKRPAVWVVCTVWLTLLLVFTELFPYLAYRSASTPKQAGRLLGPLLPPSTLPGHVITGYPVWGGALILVLGHFAGARSMGGEPSRRCSATVRDGSLFLWRRWRASPLRSRFWSSSRSRSARWPALR